jgi:hypothetical protein
MNRRNARFDELMHENGRRGSPVASQFVVNYAIQSVSRVPWAGTGISRPKVGIPDPKDSTSRQ